MNKIIFSIRKQWNLKLVVLCFVFICAYCNVTKYLKWKKDIGIFNLFQSKWSTPHLSSDWYVNIKLMWSNRKRKKNMFGYWNHAICDDIVVGNSQKNERWWRIGGGEKSWKWWAEKYPPPSLPAAVSVKFVLGVYKYIYICV